MIYLYDLKDKIKQLNSIDTIVTKNKQSTGTSLSNNKNNIANCALGGFMSQRPF